MSKLFKIDEETFFGTVTETKDKLHIAITDFGRGYKGCITVSEAIKEAKTSNSFMSFPDEVALNLLKAPADTAKWITQQTDSEGISQLQFRYQIEKFGFKFRWSLTKMDEASFRTVLIMPAFDALVRLQRNINKFNLLSRQAAEDLDRLPVYAPFDIKYLLTNLDSLDLLSHLCRSCITIQAPPTPKKMKPFKSPRKGVKKRPLARDVLNKRIQRKLMEEKLKKEESSDSSIDDLQNLSQEEKSSPVVAAMASMHTSVEGEEKAKEDCLKRSLVLASTCGQSIGTSSSPRTPKKKKFKL